MAKFEYRIIKSSWGIVIDIMGNHEIVNQFPERGSLIYPKIWLDLRAKNLTSEEKKWIIKGIDLAKQAIYSQIQESSNVLLVISDIRFALTDYQPEGLVIAVWGWINQEFNLPPPNIEVAFNKIDNKYHFSWNEVN